MALAVAQIAPRVCANASLRNSIARLNIAIGTMLRAPIKKEADRNCRMVATMGS